MLLMVVSQRMFSIEYVFLSCIENRENEQAAMVLLMVVVGLER